MGRLPPRGIQIRRERVTGFSVAWLLLAVFIIARSAGTWSPYEPGVWAPTLVKPADVVRNVAVYIPFGVLGMLVLDRRDGRGVLRVMAIALIFSLAVEALQLYTVDRVASLTDIASAVAGSCIGASATAWWRRPR